MTPPLKQDPSGSPQDWLAHAESDLNLARSEADLLTPYAAETRYPGHLEEITPFDVDEAIRLAEAVLQWAAKILRS